MVPIVDFPSGDLEDRLFRRRRVLVSGPLDAETANRVSVELVALDGRSGDNAELYINSDGGPLADVLTVCRPPATGATGQQQLRRRLDDLELVRHHVVAALVSATGQPAASLIDQLDHGLLLGSQRRPDRSASSTTSTLNSSHVAPTLVPWADGSTTILIHPS